MDYFEKNNYFKDDMELPKDAEKLCKDCRGKVNGNRTESK